MKNKNMKKIFLVDDDVLFLKLLEIEFEQKGNYAIETFETGELCLQKLGHLPDVIILDYHLDGIKKGAMNGIDTLDKIRMYLLEIPVIMLSSQDKIDVAVNCMRHGAFDYVVKSETAFLRLEQIIANIDKYQKMEKQLNWYMDRM